MKNAPARTERIDSPRGVALLEALVATTIMVVGVAALAELLVVSARANADARTTGIATLLAVQKMEQLRALAWGFDAGGLPRSDTATDTTRAPESATGGTGLRASPPGALSANTAGYVDYLDAGGTPLGGSSPIVPDEAVFIRRWSIEPLPANPANTLVLQVLVTRSKERRGDVSTPGSRRFPDEARLVSVKARKAM